MRYCGGRKLVTSCFYALFGGDCEKRFWVGIQWRADVLLFDFETCSNYQKLP